METPSVLFGTCARHKHAQQIARALHEADALGVYRALGVDHYDRAWTQHIRNAVKDYLPALDQLLRRRRITTVPDALVSTDWTWNVPRTIAARVGFSRLADWLWERSEWKLDRDLARAIRSSDFDAIFGIEHGALAAFRAAREVGKPRLLGFTSPHHSALRAWVHEEYEKFPDLLSPSRKRILEKEPRRYERKDEEAKLASFVHTNSEFSKRTLVEGGIDADKIHVVPLGCPEPLSVDQIPGAPPETTRIIYAGTASVRKGFHYLIEAWRALAPEGNTELHCFGKVTVPDRIVQKAPSSVKFHGSVPQEQLFEAFRTGTVLVLPTLLDGFGMVVSEALAHGLPVVTTPNAGAADLIDEEENGFLVPPRDSEALCDRLNWIVQHPRQVHSMREVALRTAGSWGWSDFRRTLRAQLEDVFGWPLSNSNEPHTP